MMSPPCWNRKGGVVVVVGIIGVIMIQWSTDS